MLAAVLARVDAHLAAADADLLARYPGDTGPAQPIHTVYVPGDRATAATPREWGDTASALLAEHAPTPAAAAAATGLEQAAVTASYERVLRALRDRPVQDLRIDFEDGYGRRPDDVEDADVGRAVRTLTELGTRQVDASPFVLGIRFKSLEAPTRRRGLRTLDLLVSGLADAGGLPPGFLVTLPKVTSVDQVEAMVLVCTELERAYGLTAGALRFEIQIETPQAIVGADGRVTVARMIATAGRRCVGLHYGTYDYSASLGIAAAHQSLDHPAADHAKAIMQITAAGTGVRLSDGSTNVVPTGGTAQVHAAWLLHAGLVTRSLERGFYQGWDMTPGHLPTRYLATYVFFRSAFPAAAARLRAYVDRVEGGVMDEPATAAALAAAVARGVDCGAVDADEAAAATGLDRAALDALARRQA